MLIVLLGSLIFTGIVAWIFFGNPPSEVTSNHPDHHFTDIDGSDGDYGRDYIDDSDDE